MSPRTRKGIRPPTAENAIQKANDLVASTDTATMKNLWEDLLQSHRAAFRSGLTSEAFPDWVLHNISHKVIPTILEAVYGRGAKSIEFYGPSLCRRFDKPQWQFVLFLGSLSQPKVTTLTAIARERTNISFDSLYRELSQIRSKRQPLPDGPLDLKLAELKSCLKTNNLRDKNKRNSNVDHQSGDETSHGTIYLSSDEDDYDRDSEVNEEDDFEDIFDSPANYSPSPELTSSVEDVLDEEIASPVHASSPISVQIPAVDAPNVRRSAIDGVTLVAKQLCQGQERQGVEPEVSEAGRLSDRGATADSITVATKHARADMQGQNDYTDETLGQHLVDLCNTTNSIATVANSLRKEHEGLGQEQVAMRSRLAKTSEDIDAAVESIQLILKSKDHFAPEQIEIGQATWSRLRDLVKKRKVEKTKYQEQQAKRMKLRADVKEFDEKWQLDERVLG